MYLTCLVDKEQYNLYCISIPRYQKTSTYRMVSCQLSRYKLSTLLTFTFRNNFWGFVLSKISKYVAASRVQERTGEVFLRCPHLRLLGEQDQRPPAYHQAAHLAPLQTPHAVYLLQEQLEETPFNPFYRKAKRFPLNDWLTKFFKLISNHTWDCNTEY